MTQRKLLSTALTLYSTCFTVAVLYGYLRGHELDIPWLAVLSTAPVVALFLINLSSRDFWSKPAEEVEHG